MTQSGMAAPPFDVFSLSEDVRKRFGWSNDDLNRAMEQLVPAAMNGFRYFGNSWPGLPAEARESAGLLPFMFQPGALQHPAEAPLTPFFGPEAVQQALAAQIAGATGLNSDAIQAMMPVAATLAMGQVARPFLQGEARNLLDAFLRGFARGRPKPQPTPVDYLQAYTDALNSFWGAFVPAAHPAEPDEADAEIEEVHEELVGEDAGVPGEAEAEPAASEFDEMISDWMEAGRNFQSTQFEAFDSFFAKASGEK